MPIKNYTSSVPADRSIAEVQSSLVKHGATGVLFEYEKGKAMVESMKFKLDVLGQSMAFQLPVDWRKFQVVLKEQNIKRWREEEYCYRVAWRNVRDWVLAQMALYETQMVDLPQVFLPYAMTQDGVSTLYDRVLNGNLLGSGKS